ncbi:MAG: hypothetical protein HC900_08690 [Methylacidiphilales bacterium]|nr:hypothetical protein [Candidatus Methylacidiphilales bacterium]
MTLRKQVRLEDVLGAAEKLTDVPYPGSFEAERASAWPPTSAIDTGT